MSRRLTRALVVGVVGLATLMAAAVLPVPARPASAVASGPPVVIFDSDMDFDDATTLAYLAQEDKLGRIDLRAVTVVNNGAGLPGRAIRHARCLVERFGLDGVSIADGSDTAPNAFPAELRQTIDNAISSALTECTASEAPSTLRAPRLIRQVLADEPGAWLIVTGPVSNVAATLPVAAHRVTSMGGAVRVPGNLCCGTPPEFDGSQEFNYWIDPQATRVFLRSNPRPVTFVPLDATNDIPITPGFIDRLRADQQTPAAEFVLRVLTFPDLAALITTGDLFWWDPPAAMSAIHPEVVTFEAGRITVVTDGPSAGRTVLSRTGRLTWFGTAADADAFEQRFLDTLNGRR